MKINKIIGNAFTCWKESGCTCEKTPNFGRHSFMERIPRYLFIFDVVKWLAVIAVQCTCPCWRKWVILLALATACTEWFRRRFSVVPLLSVWLLLYVLLRCVKSWKTTTRRISSPRYESFTYRSQVSSLTATPVLSAKVMFLKRCLYLKGLIFASIPFV